MKGCSIDVCKQSHALSINDDWDQLYFAFTSYAKGSFIITLVILWFASQFAFFFCDAHIQAK